ncbi:alpha/beta hydrolase [Litorihabitans aurantiacus]|uniref:alpha/beta hydrolase n=1 Tax=Litorihabitans aurantiacus TaxID=1930061 RepID=UPI0024E09FCC|nr:alpha/beta hydrolase [Litorihabitans aurantiacus]
MIEAWLTRSAELAASPEAPPDEREHARWVSDALFTEFGVAPPAARRTTHEVPTDRGLLRIDVYRPPGRGADVVPAYLVLHGGAFRFGHPDELVNVAFCSARAVDAGVAVVCVDYALAPENPHPAATLDARDALRWLVERARDLAIDPDRIVVGGVSAGGALAAGLCAWARDHGVAVRGQLLEVPVVDLSPGAPWLDEHAALNGLGDLETIREGYATPDEALTAEVSPLRGDLAGLPPTHVMTAELDPLRAGGEELVRRLRAAGTEVTATRHLGEVHASQALLRGWRGARLWHREVVAVLRDLVG